jgi:hypothetical protein
MRPTPTGRQGAGGQGAESDEPLSGACHAPGIGLAT